MNNNIIKRAEQDIVELIRNQINACNICTHKFGDDPTFCLECDDEELNGNFEWRGVTDE